MLRNILNQLTTLCLILALATLLLGFTGLPEGLNYPSDWAKAGLTQASDSGLVIKLEGNPKYADSTTRLQFCQLVVNLVERVTGEQLPEADISTFSDTQAPEALKAYEAGIMGNSTGDEFSPYELINREQLAVVIFRAVRYIEEKTGKMYFVENADVSAYSDNADISSWAKDSVGILRNNDILTTESALLPKAEVTIEDSLVLMNIVYQKVL